MDMTDKFLICDFDGCLTCKDDMTYFNPDPLQYHASAEIVSRIKKFCKENDAKVVISSNWRKFDANGTWTNSCGTFRNPLPDLIDALGDCYFCTLPKIRHLCKANVLILWLESLNKNIKFAVFDDDLREEYQTTADYRICEKFILCDAQHGITAENLKEAKTILDMQ